MGTGGRRSGPEHVPASRQSIELRFLITYKAQVGITAFLLENGLVGGPRTHRIERIVGAPGGDLPYRRDRIVLARVDRVGRAPLPGEIELFIGQADGNDGVGLQQVVIAQSPSLRWVTFFPAWVTTPTPSWPSTQGQFSTGVLVSSWICEAQMPVAVCVTMT